MIDPRTLDSTKVPMRGANAHVATIEDAGFMVTQPSGTTMVDEANIKVKRKRGDVPGMAHIDESGFMDANGKPIYTVTIAGVSRQLVDSNGLALDAPSQEVLMEIHREALEALDAAEQRQWEAWNTPAAKQQRALEDTVRNAFNRDVSRSDPKVVAHKRGVVKAHKKLVRKQNKETKFKALQAKAFTHGK